MNNIIMIIGYATDLLTRAVILIRNNFSGIAIAIFIAVIIGIVPRLYRLFCDWKDRRKIYNYLKTSVATSEYQFRSTEAISAAVKLTQSQVERLCISHPKIMRNTAQKQSWQLVD